MKPTLKGLLSEEIPPFEVLLQEEELPPINLKSTIDCISSVPVYDRLDIDKRLLSEKETKLIELQTKVYNDKITSLFGDEKLETHNDDFIILESEYSEVGGCSDSFLKKLYNCTDDDDLLVNIKKSMACGEAIQKSLDEEKFDNEIETYTPSKEFSQFLRNASDGIHDNLIVYGTLISQDSSSDISSDENDEIRVDKVKALSYKFKFRNSSNSKFLEPIINANKLNAFKIISESSTKIPSLKKEEILLSDSESENYLKKKNLAFEFDKKSNKPSPHETKKDVKLLKKKGGKCETNETKKQFKKKNECKVQKPKETKVIENVQGSCSQSNTPTKDQVKVSSPLSSNILVNPKQLTNINKNSKKNIKKKLASNETSSSGDEDWENLAEKNLLLRSKTLGQKPAMK